jgi:hypothetical protein
LIWRRLDMVLDEEARKKILPPRTYTLVLEATDANYSIYYYNGQFILAVEVGNKAEHLIEESDWDHFYEQIPQEPRASDSWIAI